MTKYLCLIFFIFLYWDLPAEEYLDTINKIEAKTAKELESKYKMSICGTGGGAMYGIDSLMLSFTIERPITIEEARTILVGSAELYLNNINKNSIVRPYLEEYPFTIKRLRLDFYVCAPAKDKNQTTLDSFSLCYGGNTKVPTISYEARNDNNRLVDIHSETYEEAKERLNEIKK